MKGQEISMPEELKPQARKIAKSHIDFGLKENLIKSEEEFWKKYDEAWDEDSKIAELCRSRGRDNEWAQMKILDVVKSDFGRTVMRPIYDVIINPAEGSVIHKTLEDDDGKAYPALFAFGMLKVEGHDIKLTNLAAFRDDVDKIDTLKGGDAFKLKVACSNINGNIVNIGLDDRCTQPAELVDDQEWPDWMELTDKIFDRVPVAKARQQASKSRRPSDWKMIEGRTETNPTKRRWGKGYQIEITDESVTLDQIKEQQHRANVTLVVGPEQASVYGKGSLVRAIGTLSYNPPEKESDTDYAPTMWYPHIIPLIVEESPRSSDEDKTADGTKDASDYYDKKKSQFIDEDDDEDDQEKTETKDEEPPEDRLLENEITDTKEPQWEEDTSQPDHPSKCPEVGKGFDKNDKDCQVCIEKYPKDAEKCADMTKARK